MIIRKILKDSNYKLTQFTKIRSNLKKKDRYIKVCFKKVKRWLWKEKISVILYIVIPFISLIGIFMVNIDIFTKEIVGYIIVILLFIAVLLDIINIFFKYKTNTFGILLLFSFSILIYFVNIQAESIAHTLVTETTGEKADYFPIVTSFFEGIYIPIAVIMLIVKNFIYFISIMTIGIILSFFVIISFDKWEYRAIHIFLFCLYVVILVLFAINSNIDKNYEAFFGENYVPKKIIEYSYYKNTNCKDVDGYMHYLYKDIISVTNVKDFNITTNGISIDFVSKEDKNITFSTQKCIRREKVSIQPIN